MIFLRGRHPGKSLVLSQFFGIDYYKARASSLPFPKRHIHTKLQVYPFDNMTNVSSSSSSSSKTKLTGQAPGLYVIDNSNVSTFTTLYNAVMDFMTILLGESGIPLWVRLWLFALMTGVVSPLAFLPHPYAIANAVAMVFILTVNCRELVRIRGINKNMGWPHVVGWIPVLVVDVLSLRTDLMDRRTTTTHVDERW